MSRSLDDWLQHWLDCHPVGIDLSLTRIRRVWQNLGAPRLATQRVITVAGTNGKGSSVRMLALLLAAKGYRVATFTSPHIHHFHERVTFFAGAAVQPVTDAQLDLAFSRIEQYRGDTTLSYFEASALAAFLCFADALPDVTILEVGLGGRLDAVNIIDADATLITSIGLDHEVYLGSDLAGIAREKAGVLRSEQVAVFASPSIPPTIAEEATKCGAHMTYRGSDFDLKDAMVTLRDTQFALPDTFSRLGQHQWDNACGVLELLTRLNYLDQSDAALVIKSLSNFSLVGRFEVVSTQPLIVVDVAHNEDSILALQETLNRYPCRGKRIAVVGMLADKAHHQALAHIDFDTWHVATLTGARGLSADVLAKAVLDVHPDAIVAKHEQVTDAIVTARQALNDRDQLIIFGSFLTVEAARAQLETFKAHGTEEAQ